jgi:hypothetical protein
LKLFYWSLKTPSGAAHTNGFWVVLALKPRRVLRTPTWLGFGNPAVFEKPAGVLSPSFILFKNSVGCCAHQRG